MCRNEPVEKKPPHRLDEPPVCHVLNGPIRGFTASQARQQQLEASHWCSAGRVSQHSGELCWDRLCTDV